MAPVPMFSWKWILLLIATGLTASSVQAQFTRAGRKSSHPYRNHYQRMAAGSDHTLEIRSGQLWAYGLNSSGQIGDNTTVNKLTPIRIGTEEDWVIVSANRYNSFGIRANGTLWGWGFNETGVVGDGTNTNRREPTRIGTDSTWVTIASGGTFTIGIKADGSLWTWGENTFGQLGLGDFTNYNTPQRVGTLNNWIAVSAGHTHAMALRLDGTVWVWGRNQYGEFGSSTPSQSNVPVQVPINYVVQIATGLNHGMALKSDGTLWTWGRADYGALGTGPFPMTNVPVQVGTDSTWTWINAGGHGSAGLKANGTLWLWGRNNFSQQGNGNTSDVFVPTRLGTANNWVGVALGINHSTASQANGMLFSWGRNNAGQLGLGHTTPQSTPVPVAKVLNWVTINTDTDNSFFAVRSDGTLWYFTGIYSGMRHVERISSDTNWVAVANRIALKADGSLWTWARIGSGPVNWTQVGTEIWREINSTGGTHHVVRADGSLWGWGMNGLGQVGDGNAPNNALSPVRISSPGLFVRKVAGKVGSIRSCTVLPGSGFSNGTQGYWGLYTFQDYLTMPDLSNADGIVDIAIGYDHTFELRVNGQVRTGGGGSGSSFNRFGQLGTNINADTQHPYIQVHAGFTNCISIKSNGSLWYWGGGRLGVNYASNVTLSPIQLDDKNNYILISLGNTSAMGLLAHRRLIGFAGANFIWRGQLIQDSIFGSHFACEGTALTLRADTNHAATYLWQGPGGFTSTANPLIRPGVDQSMAGIYTLTISLYEHTFTDTHSITVTPAPGLVITASNNTVLCTGDSTTLNASGASSYIWSTGQTAAAITVQQAGTYQVTGITSQGCIDSVSEMITVLPIPVVTITPSGTISLCEGDTVTLQAGGASSYLWNTQSSQPGIAVFVNGNFLVTGTDNNGCSAQPAPVQVQLIPRPVMPFISGAQTVAIGQNTVLTASPGSNLSWWNAVKAGNQIGAGSTYPIVNFSQALTVFAQEQGSNGCVSPRQAFTVNPPQSIWAASPMCAGTPLYLRVVRPISSGTFLWTGPNGYSSSQREPAISNARSGHTGWYRLRVDSAQVRVFDDSVFLQVNNPVSQIQVGATNPICAGQNLVLSADVFSGARYLWQGPNGFSSRLPQTGVGNVTLQASGQYVLNVEVPGCPSGQRQVSVSVNAFTPPNPGSNAPVCFGNTLTLTAGLVAPRGAVYLWEGPNGYSSTSQNITFPGATPSRNGIYTLTASTPGCQTVVQTHTVLVYPAVSTTGSYTNSPVCVGDSLFLSTQLPVQGNYLWTGPNGFTSNSRNLQIAGATPDMSGPYYLYMTLPGCTTVNRIFPVVVSQLPDPMPSANSPVCQGGVINLTALSLPGVTYNWSGPGGFVSSAPSPSITNAQTIRSGTYTLRSSIVGCTGASTHLITVQVGGSLGNVVARATPNPVCAGATLQLTGTSIGNAQMSWAGPHGFSASGNIATRPGMTVFNAGQYTYSVVSPGCSSTTRTVSVSVNTTGVTAGLIHNPICALNPVYFTATAPAGSTYSWTGPGGFQSTIQNPSIVKATPLQAGVYTVNVIVPGCDLVQATATLVVNNCREGREEEDLDTEAIPDLEQSLQAIQLSVFPNPTNGKVSAVLSGYEGEEMPELTIMDVLGQKINVPLKTENAGGRYQWQVDLSQQSKGIYFLLWKGGGIHRTERLILN